MMWARRPSSGKGTLPVGSSPGGRPTAPMHLAWRGHRLSQTGLGLYPPPCSWCPLLWVGLQALSHGFGGVAASPFSPSSKLREEILGRRQQRRPRVLGGQGGAGAPAPGAALPSPLSRDQAAAQGTWGG